MDKRAHFDLENNYREMQDKNRVLMTELYKLRRETDMKEKEKELMEKRLAASEKNLATMK